ncbi:MAG: radical SAM protein [Desulfobacteraceae bacterium]|nr:radical SAM protein [Desulfobacteraceae bacterium]
MEALKCCTLCPRQCAVDRSAGDTGFCQTGARAKVASYNAHFGEEAPLVGRYGSGTIFFSHCNLLCNFCQNYEISHLGEGREVTDRQLADLMLDLQAAGCHNINFVTPSHVVPQILAALLTAAGDGLRIPLVFNTGGYDTVETLKLLEGIVDIYMPDFKFWDSEMAEKTCQAPDYPEVARAALLEMHRQVGDLFIDAYGLAQRGLLVRHLVMPKGMAGTRQAMRFIAANLSRNTYVNIMPQYRPCGRAHDIPELRGALTSTEFNQALKEANEEGITRLDQRRRVFIIP